MSWSICTDCGTTLSAEEQHFYDHRCEACERAAWARLQAWRRGAADHELDRRYGAPAPTVH